MIKRINPFAIVLLSALVVRGIAMSLVPLVETTEPRYADIARVMAESGDWITPWFDTDVPFWGKPPLSFWAQAASINLFGVNEFAVRLPSLLATLGILLALFQAARLVVGSSGAWLSVVIYFTTASGYALSGAVLTDPFLTLATTLALLSLLKVYCGEDESGLWQYGLFVAVAIGLLAKGPIAGILVFAPVMGWMLVAWRRGFKRIPWVTGTVVMLAIALPWYIAAELKTPGFLDYFIIGEHIRRFIDTGWSGDLYGSAHDYARGTIWWFAIWASFPWGIFALVWLAYGVTGRALTPTPIKPSAPTLLLLAWMLCPLLFFTFSGNILWTYLLPALPPFAILLVKLVQRVDLPAFKPMMFTAVILPVCCLALSLGTLHEGWLNKLETEKTLIRYIEDHHRDNKQIPVLYYLGQPPFSARFYSHGSVEGIDGVKLLQVIQNSGDKPFYVAVRSRDLDGRLQPLYSNSRYSLFDATQLTSMLEQKVSEKEESQNPNG